MRRGDLRRVSSEDEWRLGQKLIVWTVSLQPEDKGKLGSLGWGMDLVR